MLLEDFVCCKGEDWWVAQEWVFCKRKKDCYCCCCCCSKGFVVEDFVSLICCSGFGFWVVVVFVALFCFGCQGASKAKAKANQNKATSMAKEEDRDRDKDRGIIILLLWFWGCVFLLQCEKDRWMDLWIGLQRLFWQQCPLLFLSSKSIDFGCVCFVCLFPGWAFLFHQSCRGGGGGILVLGWGLFHEWLISRVWCFFWLAIQLWCGVWFWVFAVFFYRVLIVTW